jgi:hypothetical protein
MSRARTEPLILDVHLDAGTVFEQPLPATHNGFVYVYRGALKIIDREVGTQRMAILANPPASDGVVLRALDAPARALLIAGRPLREPIMQYGPFVMNTRDELMQAVQDYQSGRLAA